MQQYSTSDCQHLGGVEHRKETLDRDVQPPGHFQFLGQCLHLHHFWREVPKTVYSVDPKLLVLQKVVRTFAKQWNSDSISEPAAGIATLLQSINP